MNAAVSARLIALNNQLEFVRDGDGIWNLQGGAGFGEVANRATVCAAIVALFKTRRRLALRFSSMYADLFCGDPIRPRSCRATLANRAMAPAIGRPMPGDRTRASGLPS